MLYQFLLCNFSLESTRCNGNQDLVLRPPGATPSCLDPAERVLFRSLEQSNRGSRLLVAQRFPRDAAEEGMTLDVTHTSTSRAQAIASIKLKKLWKERINPVRYYCLLAAFLCHETEELWVEKRWNLTSVSKEAAAVLRWSGMSSWVWEWIPAGWSCHSGCRHSRRSVRETGDPTFRPKTKYAFADFCSPSLLEVQTAMPQDSTSHKLL